MSLNGRVRRLEERAGTSPVDLEGQRKRTEELRARITARLQRVIDAEDEKRRRAGLPPIEEVVSPEETARQVQELKQALRRRAGL